MMKRLIILGAGGYGRTVADIARQSGKYEAIFFLDDQQISADVIGKCTDYLKFADTNTEMYPAFGNNEGRLNWLNRLKENNILIATMVHPTAYVSSTVVLHEGVMVLPNSVINTNCLVHRGCIVNCGAIVDHDCVLEEGVHVCLGAIVKAENRIPRALKVEAGEVVENRYYSL